MRTIRLAFLLLLAWPSGLPGALEYRLMTGDRSARASGEWTVLVAVTNPDAIEAGVDLPERTVARVGSRSVQLERKMEGFPLGIAPGTTVLVEYRGILPDDLDGLLAVELEVLAAGRCYVEVVSGDEAGRSPSTGPTSPMKPAPVGKSSREIEESRVPRFARNISFYEPIYFVVGPRVSLNAKFQLGFKYRLLSEEASLAAAMPALGDLYLGYTQTSLWDLGSESKPFLDTSYKPGLFYYEQYSGIRFFGFELEWIEGGYQHESNGQGGEDSRSLNTVYVRPSLRYDLPKDWYLRFMPRGFVYIDDLSDNPDLPEYRGYFDLSLKIGQLNGLELSTLVRIGTEPGVGSFQLDLTYPMDRLFFGNAASFLHLQYFDGWGETLLNYDQRLPSQVRIGFTLLR
ncbi:MAG: phospholipase A [Opitutaceae bacterium]